MKMAYTILESGDTMPQPGNLQKTYEVKTKLSSIFTMKTLISWALPIGKMIMNQIGTYSYTSMKIVEDEMRMYLSFF